MSINRLTKPSIFVLVFLLLIQAPCPPFTSSASAHGISADAMQSHPGTAFIDEDERVIEHFGDSVFLTIADTNTTDTGMFLYFSKNEQEIRKKERLTPDTTVTIEGHGFLHGSPDSSNVMLEYEYIVKTEGMGADSKPIYGHFIRVDQVDGTPISFFDRSNVLGPLLTESEVPSFSFLFKDGNLMFIENQRALIQIFRPDNAIDTKVISKFRSEHTLAEPEIFGPVNHYTKNELLILRSTLGIDISNPEFELFRVDSNGSVVWKISKMNAARNKIAISPNKEFIVLAGYDLTAEDTRKFVVEVYDKNATKLWKKNIAEWGFEISEITNKEVQITVNKTREFGSPKIERTFDLETGTELK